MDDLPVKALIYRYGDRYRVIGLYSDPPHGGGGKGRGNADEEENGGRSLSNLYRARSTVRELAFCNSWEWFVTITINEANQDRYSISETKKRWGLAMKDFKKRYGERFSYIIVPEQHKDGAWHMHGLFHDVPPEALVKNEHGYWDMPFFRRRFGFVSLSKIRDKERTCSYVTKYVTKSINESGGGMRFGEHLFFSSQGLQRKVKLCEVWIKLPWQYQNDYCLIYETKDFNLLDSSIIKEIK